jgi:hypothetical protein
VSNDAAQMLSSKRMRAAACAAAIVFGVVQHDVRADDGDVVRLAFDDNAGQPILTATIGDLDGLRVLVDTGASPCVLDRRRIEQLQLTLGNASERKGGGGTFSSRAVSDPVRMQFARSSLACTKTIATDLAAVSDLIGQPIDAIVGGDFFVGRIVRIDYDRGVIELHARDGYRHAGVGERVPIRIENNRPLVTMRLSIPGRERVARERIVDTGSFDAVSDPLIGELADAASRRVSTSGLGDGTASRAGRFTRVEIGAIVFEDVRGVVPVVPIVGNAILARFNLVFDYDGGWMVLEPRAREPQDERLRLRW